MIALLLAVALAQQADFDRVVQDRFEAWDADGNGKLSSAELDRLVTSPAIHGTEAAAVAAIKQVQRSGKWTPDAVTRDLLAADPEEGGPGLDKRFADGLRKLTRSSRDIFEEGAPSLDAFHQGRGGDCFLLAPLGALIHRDREGVRKMIAPRDDGGFAVTFARRTVDVAPLTDVEIILTSGTEGEGLWLSILEKAAATVKNDALPDAKEKESVTDVIAHGGATKWSIRLLTGSEPQGYGIRAKGKKDRPPSEEEVAEHLPRLRELFTGLLAAHKLVCAGTPEKPGVPGIASRHAYAILEFDEATDTLHMWNPWGNPFKPKGPDGLENGYTTKAGHFRLPLREFVQVFGGGSYEP